MARRKCPHCGSEKATTVMLPSTAGSHDSRPHPAFRCMTCDAQWTDQDGRARAEGTTEEGGQPPQPKDG